MPGNTRSCKSPEVIQNPRGVVAQARMNPGFGCLPLKQATISSSSVGGEPGGQERRASGCTPLIPHRCQLPWGLQ